MINRWKVSPGDIIVENSMPILVIASDIRPDGYVDVLALRMIKSGASILQNLVIKNSNMSEYESLLKTK